MDSLWDHSLGCWLYHGFWSTVLPVLFSSGRKALFEWLGPLPSSLCGLYPIHVWQFRSSYHNVSQLLCVQLVSSVNIAQFHQCTHSHSPGKGPHRWHSSSFPVWESSLSRVVSESIGGLEHCFHSQLSTYMLVRVISSRRMLRSRLSLWNKYKNHKKWSSTCM